MFSLPNFDSETVSCNGSESRTAGAKTKSAGRERARLVGPFCQSTAKALAQCLPRNSALAKCRVEAELATIKGFSQLSLLGEETATIGMSLSNATWFFRVFAVEMSREADHKPGFSFHHISPVHVADQMNFEPRPSYPTENRDRTVPATRACCARRGLKREGSSHHVCGQPQLSEHGRNISYRVKT